MTKNKITRFAVTIEENLLQDFDESLKEQGYSSRSQAVQDLIRNYLVEQKWDERENAMGTITLVFDHHKRNLSKKLTEIQHDFHDQIISNMHIHLDSKNCLEVLAVKGKGEEIRDLANKLISTKGVLHGKLTLTFDGE